jgi:hypothetical protein
MPPKKSVPVKQNKKRKVQDLQQNTPQLLQVPPVSQVSPVSQIPPVSQVLPVSQVPPVSQVLPVSQVPQVSQVPPVSKVPPVSQVPQVPQQFQKTFEKIISQNAKIINRLDALVTSQKSIEERMKKLEDQGLDKNDELVKVTSLSLFKFIIIINTN